MYVCTLTGMAKKQTHDPEGRKRVIAAAAAELIMELGMSNVTHRKVAERAGVPLGSTTQHFANLDELLRAAIVHLSDESTQDLEKLAAKLEKATDIPRTLARMLSVYLSDPAWVRMETVFYIAYAEHPELRNITTLWNRGLLDVLSRHMDERAAQDIITYGNGVLMRMIQEDAVISEDELARVFLLLMKGH